MRNRRAAFFGGRIPPKNASQRVADSINAWSARQRKNNPCCRLELHCYREYSKTRFTHQNTLWLSDAKKYDVDIKTWISYALDRHPGKVYVDVIWS